MEFHVAGELQPTKLVDSVVHAGQKNGELVKAGVVGGDCRDKALY